MSRKILMVAYHFPPAAIGSGHLRTLGFVRHLPALGWEPMVLSANAAAFPRTDTTNNELIPDDCRVYRAFALDARRHFGLAGKYPAFLAKPDRWVSWWPAGVWQGLRLISRHKISVIWSTYPIMTAHCIADTLSRLTGLPWIADFRDPVSSSVQAGSPHSAASQHRWERRVLRRATRAVFTTPSALRAYAERFPEVHRAGRLAVIGNGYDESAFSGLPSLSARQSGKPLTLLHGGGLYPDGRDPFPFFSALAKLKAAGKLGSERFRVVLRASGCEMRYQREIDRLGISDIVALAPPVGNREALLEQASADALLLFQGKQFDLQIPVKAYEYLRIGRPIFALVGENGDTAALLRETGGAVLVAPDDVPAIEKRLSEFIRALCDGLAPKADETVVRRYSRSQGAALLASMLDRVIAHG